MSQTINKPELALIDQPQVLNQPTNSKVQGNLRGQSKALAAMYLAYASFQSQGNVSLLRKKFPSIKGNTHCYCYVF